MNDNDQQQDSFITAGQLPMISSQRAPMQSHREIGNSHPTAKSVDHSAHANNAVATI